MKHREKWVIVLSAGVLLGCSTQYAKRSAHHEPAGNAMTGRQQRGIVEQNVAAPAALNARAVSQAQAGQLEDAIALLRQAVAQEPQSAYLHNNLGYALLLAGRFDAAELAMRQALALNPASEMAHKNMGLLSQAQARAAVIQVQQMQQMQPPSAPAAPPSPAAASTGPEIVAVAPQVYQLRDAQPADSPASPVLASHASAQVMGMAATRAEVLPVLKGVRIEVSNGVGLRHLARRTAERLAPLGLVAARLTNQPGYHQVKTEIQYGSGHKRLADALSAQLPAAIETVPVPPMARQIQMRLVLGRDQAGQAIAAWLDTPPPPAMAFSAGAGWLWS